MSALILGLLAETFIHPGAGATGTAIDLPVMREAGTDYPFIPGSGLKGALKDAAEERKLPDIDNLFGKQEDGGKIIVSDVRLLLLPVRSLTGSYKWATCPHLLERLHRDLTRSGMSPGFSPLIHDKAKTVLGNGTGTLMLEERKFTFGGEPEAVLATALGAMIQNAEAKKRLAGQVAVLTDDDFAWFARYGLAVHARNKLTENKTSENLWYEEALPPDTVMYAIVGERVPAASAKLKPMFEGDKGKPYLRVGGNETVGQGWFAVTLQGSA